MRSSASSSAIRRCERPHSRAFSIAWPSWAAIVRSSATSSSSYSRGAWVRTFSAPARLPRASTGTARIDSNASSSRFANPRKRGSRWAEWAMAIGSRACAACPVMPSPTRMRGVGPSRRDASDRRAEHELAVRRVELVDEACVGLERGGDRRRDALQHLVELERGRGRGDDVREQGEVAGGGLHACTVTVRLRSRESSGERRDRCGRGHRERPLRSRCLPRRPSAPIAGRRADPAPTMLPEITCVVEIGKPEARGRQQDAGCGRLCRESLCRLEREDALPEGPHDAPAARVRAERDRRRGREDHPGRAPRSCPFGPRR